MCVCVRESSRQVIYFIKITWKLRESEIANELRAIISKYKIDFLFFFFFILRGQMFLRRHDSANILNTCSSVVFLSSHYIKTWTETYLISVIISHLRTMFCNAWRSCFILPILLSTQGIILYILWIFFMQKNVQNYYQEETKWILLLHCFNLWAFFLPQNNHNNKKIK